MRKMSEYMVTIDSIYPDGYARENVFRDSGEMVSARTGRVPGSVLHRLIEEFRVWRMKRTGRLALRELDDHQLRDIGVTRCEADHEASKSLYLFR